MTEDDTVPVELPGHYWREYSKIRAEIDELKKALSLLDEVIRVYIDAEAKGHNAEVTFEGASIGSYTRVDSLRLDTNKLRVEQPSIYDAYVKPATTWRLAWGKGEW